MTNPANPQPHLTTAKTNGYLGSPVIRSKPPRAITEPLSQADSALNIVIDGQRVRPPVAEEPQDLPRETGPVKAWIN